MTATKRDTQGVRIDMTKTVTLDLNEVAPILEEYRGTLCLGDWLRITASADEKVHGEILNWRPQLLRWIAEQVDEQAKAGPAEPTNNYAMVRARVSPQHPWLTWVRDPDAVTPTRPWCPAATHDSDWTPQPWGQLEVEQVIYTGHPF